MLVGEEQVLEKGSHEEEHLVGVVMKLHVLEVVDDDKQVGEYDEEKGLLLR